MKNIEKVVIPVIVIVIITMLGIYYISKEYEKQRAEKRAEEIRQTVEEQQAENPVSAEDLTYEAVAMLVAKNTDEGKLKFISVDSERLFELDYDNRTSILAKHGNYITLDEIPLGEILDISYGIHNKKLTQIQISDQAWTFTGVTKFDINEDEGRMDIAGSTYRLPSFSIVSYGDQLATFMDVTNVDTLTVKGWDRKVCSVIVERGHGYVRLQNDPYFVGGWIEIGQDIIKRVTDEMLIPVPEGDYHVRLTNRGYAAEEDATIERDKEFVLDLSNVDIKEVAIGHVEFTIVPDYAQLYVDGQMTDFEERVSLEYGIHRIHVELAGYNSVDTNIRVSDKYANVDIALEEEDGATPTPTKTATPSPTQTATPTPTPVVASNDNSNEITRLTNAVPTQPLARNTSSSSTATGTDSGSTGSNTEIISNTRKMYVQSPEGTEVFLDGIYVGIAPVSFLKPDKGSHVITLSKNGCVTKSYTVSVADDDNDVNLSFSELVSQ